MAQRDSNPSSGALIRLPALLRVLFYSASVASALLAVLSTNADGGSGDTLMVASWYLLLGSLALFGLMVLVNLLVAQQPAPRAGLPRSPRDQGH